MEIIIGLSIIGSAAIWMAIYFFLELRKSERKLINQENAFFIEYEQIKLELSKVEQESEYQKRLVNKYQRLNNKMSLKIDELIDKRFKAINPTPAKNKKKINFN